MSDQRDKKLAQNQKKQAAAGGGQNAVRSRPPQGLWLLLSGGLVILSLLGYWAMQGASRGQENGEGQPTFGGLAQLATSTPTSLFKVAAATATAIRVAQPTQAAASTKAPVKPGDWDLTIIHTNDVRGYLDPCG